METTEPRAPRRGLSRRDMIKGAAVAGAAAWTAPVIIDSLSSPAAAASCGNKYYMKLVGPNGAGTLGDCYFASPACNSSTQNLTASNTPGSTTCTSNGGYTWVCTGGTGHTTKFRSNFQTNGTGTSASYTVTLASGCTFSSTTNYMAVGNYAYPGTAKCVAGTATNGGNTATFAAYNGSLQLSYMYMEFTCN